MAYQFSWYTPRRVIYIHLAGTLTLAELAALKEESRTFALNGDAPVHAIIDCLEVTGLPHDLRGILREMRQGESPLENAFSVIVTSNRLAQFLSSTLFQLLKLELRIAPTVADAVEILTRFDATLLKAIEPQDTGQQP